MCFRMLVFQMHGIFAGASSGGIIKNLSKNTRSSHLALGSTKVVIPSDVVVIQSVYSLI